MTLRTALAALAVALSFAVTLPATTPLMPVEEIRPGMVGIGRTVFEGTELRDFKVHILGVLRNVQGPRRDLILARLEGESLAVTGVAQGMSGSPVYIDGRLIGAVSYSIGAFPKEPIAGITPIAEMKEATAEPRAASRRARLELPITPERLSSALAAVSARLTPFASRPSDVHGIGLSAAAAAQLGPMLRPISTPLLLGGFEPRTVDLLAGPFTSAGFTPVVTGAGGPEVPAANEPLREGDAIGVSLIRGDLEMAATGTVTHIDGDRVYAFGHPFYNLGPAEFPMTRAYVYTVLPSLMTSFKISTLGDVIGTMHQDRATAIAGTLGRGPRLIPMTVTLERAGAEGAAARRTFKYELVNDQLFTPLLAYVTMFNTLGSYERQFGASTFSVKSRARIQGHTDLTVEDVFTGDTPILGAATAVAGPLTMLLSNDIERITLEGLDISIASAETPLSVSIERVWLDEVRPRAGRTIPLKILTRSYRGEETISTVPIDIPANASGSLSILVSDGRQLNAVEQRDLRRSLEPQTVAQLVRILNDTRRNNRVYIRLLTGTPGAIVNGEAMTALPPSVLSVLEGDRNGGDFTPIRSATLGEWELPMESAVTGSRLLTISVENGAAR